MALSYQHQPVLLTEVLTALAIKPQGIYIDATFGRGGHAKAILSQLDSTGRLLAIDKDPAAVLSASQQHAGDSRFSIQQGSFANLQKWVTEQGLQQRVSGILFDLGVSSPQLDDPERGFSFLRDGPLDMRMDPTMGIDAAAWLNTAEADVIATVLKEYGEERFARRIAHAIVRAREVTPFTTTKQLAEVVAAANPRWEPGKHPATRAFQAIRIFINQELEDLRTGLIQALDVLEVGGRLAVISFHSLEDRIVKQFFQLQERGDVPLGLPVREVDIPRRLRILGRAVKPTAEEVKLNPRARSAVLRVAEKLL